MHTQQNLTIKHHSSLTPIISGPKFLALLPYTFLGKFFFCSFQTKQTPVMCTYTSATAVLRASKAKTAGISTPPPHDTMIDNYVAPNTVG